MPTTTCRARRDPSGCSDDRPRAGMIAPGLIARDYLLLAEPAATR
jgi:hypothetical protein